MATEYMTLDGNEAVAQGLMLMISNMYKIAGELTIAVIYVAARSLAAMP